jgi:hypothetical protein
MPFCSYANLCSYANYTSYAKCATDVIYAVVQNYANYTMNSGDPGDPGILVSWKAWRKKGIRETGRMCRGFNQ